MAFDSSGNLYVTVTPPSGSGPSVARIATDGTSTSFGDNSTTPAYGATVCPAGISTLTFPLAGLTPYTATINSVFDHSMADASGRFHIYGSGSNVDGVVQAYTAAKGQKIYGTGKGTKIDQRCYPQDSSQDKQFVIGSPNQYSGGNFLCYDNHPGYDYRAAWGTAVQAAVHGVVSYPDTLDGLGVTLGWNVLEINTGNGIKVEYLHLSTNPRTISRRVNSNYTDQNFIGVISTAASVSMVSEQFAPAKAVPHIDQSHAKAPAYSVAGNISGTATQKVLVQLVGTTTADGTCVTMRTKTDKTGAYTFSGLQDGYYNITPVLDGYSFSRVDQTGVIPSGSTVNAGDTVGASGNASPYSVGCLAPHLHFEVQESAPAALKSQFQYILVACNS